MHLENAFIQCDLQCIQARGVRLYIVCDIIIIVVLTMCNLTISSILQKPN